jgi:cellulose synthase/poly-beta-1,6-N-acetylglucosamine synthase-like glycosyltransferase
VVRLSNSRPHSPLAASIVIACYNESEILARTLAAFARQTVPDFELIIADDGSREDYRPLLEQWALRFRHPIQHVRQDDQGFRKTRILNRAVFVSRSDKLIFVDMDCLPRHDFVQQHLRYLAPGVAVTGRRVHIEPDQLPSAETILRKGLSFSVGRLLGLRLRGKARLIEHGVVLPFLYESPGRGILGCNFSICKTDFEKVNGFNSEYIGVGWEDTDIDFRLQLAGVQIRVLRNKVIEYHAAHPQRFTDDKLNAARLETVRVNRMMRASLGLAEICPGDFEHLQYAIEWREENRSAKEGP